MKIAVGILAILLSFAIGFQSCTAGLSGSLTDDQKTTETGAVGALVAILFIVGGAFSFAKPKVSRVVFIIAAVFAFLASSDPGHFKDMPIWGVVSVIFAVLSHFSIKENLNVAQKVVATPKAVEPKETKLVEGRFCVKCGAKNTNDNLFCSKCGTQLA